MDLRELRENRLGALVSGGLSATAVTAWLAESGHDVIAYIADIGQVGPFDARRTAEMLTDHGVATRLIDLRESMAEMGLALVRHQAIYEGGYWNTTGAARKVLVEGLVGPLQEDGCRVLVHGCVGGGNDQRRFDRYTDRYAPGLPVFKPWTHSWMLETFPNRAAMFDFLVGAGYPTDFKRFIDYSMDGNLTGYSHESETLENIAEPVDRLQPLMSLAREDAPDREETVDIAFESGVPVAFDAEPVSPLAAMQNANAIGARNGLPLRDVIENRINGTKCRGVYESPGLDLLGEATRAIYRACLDQPSSELAAMLFAKMAHAVYEGRVGAPDAMAVQAALEHLAADCSGVVTVNVYKGSVQVVATRIWGAQHTPDRQTRFTQGGHAWAIES